MPYRRSRRYTHTLLGYDNNPFFLFFFIESSFWPAVVFNGEVDLTSSAVHNDIRHECQNEMCDYKNSEVFPLSNIQDFSISSSFNIFV